MTTDYVNPSREDEAESRIEQVAPSTLAILSQSEHAAMVQTANLPANQRRLRDFDSKLKAYATYSPAIALSMFYSLPRAGKQIIGPSVRFAEIVAPTWKNCSVASRVIGEAGNTVTGQGVFLDYEANLRNGVEVPRRITDKNGNRYSDDMIVSTANAAMSIARRNAVLKGGVPQALWTPAYEEAQLTAVGKGVSHAQRVESAMEYLHKLGVTEWQILNAVGVTSPRELETEHLLTMRVLCEEIKRGDKTIEEVFGSVFDKEIDAAFAQLKMNQAQQTMLKNSYMGRANELAEYLRERLGTTGSGSAAPPASAAPVAQPQVKQRQPPEQPQPAPEVKAYRVNIEAAEKTPKASQPAPQPAPQAAAEATPAKPRDPVSDEQPTITSDDLPDFDDLPPGLASEPNYARPSAPPVQNLSPFSAEPQARPQSTMEPPPRKRGRPPAPRPEESAPPTSQDGFEF